ncbi:MAG: AlpA family phage regulatory protein [Paracoccaceae bacterium]
MQQLLSSKQVSARVSLSVSQIRRLISAKKFSKPLKISVRRNGWLEKDVDDWVLNLIGGSDNDWSQGLYTA